MKRRNVAVTVHDQTRELGSTIVHAWNSGNREAEAAVRTIARDEGQTYSRGPAAGTVGDSRSTVWTGDRTGRVLIATVEMLPR